MKNNKSIGFSIFISVMSTIMFLLLIITLFRTLIGRGDKILTFEGLLNFLNNFPSFDIENLPNLTINGDWGIFNFFRNFLNIYTGALNLLIFLCANLYNAYRFILYGFYTLFLI